MLFSVSYQIHAIKQLRDQFYILNSTNIYYNVYKTVHGVTWEEAKSICEEHGEHLPIIHSEEQNLRLADYLFDNHLNEEVFIGAQHQYVYCVIATVYKDGCENKLQIVSCFEGMLLVE